ncbi:MAG: hypothetical protein Q7S35_14010 [Candidatus Limnocylindrales bacterium]|nr:hypothetical protein [Candidatus Limnocylindrales bacterium]
MAGFTTKSFDSPDETRTPPRTRVEVVRLGGDTAARFTFEPGWRWSEAVKSIAGTDSCQLRHVGAVVSGRLHVAHVACTLPTQTAARERLDPVTRL